MQLKMKEKRAQPEENSDSPAKKKTKIEDANNAEPRKDNGFQNKADIDQPEERDAKPDKEVQKRKRVRVKTIRQDISKQLEFYFCDANLRKDRYMKELVAGGQDGWVNVDEFLKFNKIKTLLEKKGIDAIEVAKAAKESELVEVSSDLTKIRRNLEKFPIKEKNQELVDDCTIYVQGLPQTANIDSIRGLFSDFGVIEYVSLPRKASGEHKGFAFIEFTEKAGAENSCKFHNLQTGGTGFNFPTEDDRVTSSARPEPAPLNNIRVISKKQWAQYKQQYLKLRKENAKMTKKLLSTFASSAKAEPGNNPRQRNAGHPNGHAHDEANKEDCPEPNHAHDVNVGRDIEEKDEEQQNRPQYAEGCIVKFEASEPLTKTAKTSLREIPGVVYVDLMENDPIAFLRFPSAEESRMFVESNSELMNIEVKTKVILEGQEEQLYWERVESMRVKKRKRGREKQRGREKLQGRYEKHVATQEKKVFNKRIVFDD